MLPRILSSCSKENRVSVRRPIPRALTVAKCSRAWQDFSPDTIPLSRHETLFHLSVDETAARLRESTIANSTGLWMDNRPTDYHPFKLKNRSLIGAK